VTQESSSWWHAILCIDAQVLSSNIHHLKFWFVLCNRSLKNVHGEVRCSSHVTYNILRASNFLVTQFRRLLHAFQSGQLSTSQWTLTMWLLKRISSALTKNNIQPLTYVTTSNCKETLPSLPISTSHNIKFHELCWHWLSYALLNLLKISNTLWISSAQSVR
jgi:hypothetical protein